MNLNQQAFEQWISAFPRERNCARWPEDTKRRGAWAGRYRDPAVQLAWEAWRAGQLEAEAYAAGELDVPVLTGSLGEDMPIH